MSATLAEAIDAFLPQTQCTRCGFAGCRPYADALAAGTSAINRCPPGGTATVDRLAALLGVPTQPIDPTCGTETAPLVAVIDEEICIGCAKCLPACPVDAIVGAKRHLHTVIIAECSGCELCLPACPVDCIQLVANAEHSLDESERGRRARQYRARFNAKTQRIALRQARRQAELERQSHTDVSQ